MNDATLWSAFLHHYTLNLALSDDANNVLVGLKMGRPHHRIVTLVAHIPGTTASELVRLLRASPQALNKPIRDLLNAGFIIAERSATDSRLKRLFATPKGEDLIAKTWSVQSSRLRRAFDQASKADVEAFMRLHSLMLDETDLTVMHALKKRIDQSQARITGQSRKARSTLQKAAPNNSQN